MARTQQIEQRLTVDGYQDLVRLGRLTPEDRCELLDGWLVPKKPKNPEQQEVAETLRDVLSTRLPSPWVCRSQAPIVLIDGIPEPDVVIVRGPHACFRQQHPTPQDTALVIEVSDSTLDRDQGTKLRSYARSSVQCYWIVNLIDRQFQVYASPQPALDPPAYAKIATYRAGDNVPVVIEGQAVMLIAVDALLTSA